MTTRDRLKSLPPLVERWNEAIEQFTARRRQRNAWRTKFRHAPSEEWCETARRNAIAQTAALAKLLTALGGNVDCFCQLAGELEADEAQIGWRICQIAIHKAMAKARLQVERSGITKGEANVKARDFLKANPNATSRQLAKEIGCSEGLVSQLPTWQAVMEWRRANRTPKAPRAISFTDKMAARTGEDDEALQQLMADQKLDCKNGDRVRHRRA